MTSDAETRIAYGIRFCFADGTVKQGGPFMTRRRRGVGDFVNFPLGPDGRSRAGKGYIWRVTALDDDGTTLVLTFERPHREMVDEIES